MLLRPVGKDYLWGGNRLKKEYNKKKIGMTPLAETWECSVHPDGESVIVTGKYKGRTLAEVIKENPSFLGTKALERGETTLPILVKFIDAEQDLSVQVHPDDEQALRMEKQKGKTEMWYILDARKGTKLVYGFEHAFTPKSLKNAIERGTLTRQLHYVPVRKGDVFLIPAGTVHAIGAGAIIAEIQENSNVTYRVYDYERLDKNGKRRELHVDKAVKVMDMSAHDSVRPKARHVRFFPGCAREVLCTCRYFETERIQMNGQFDFSVLDASFQVLLCIEGAGKIRNTHLKRGMSFEKGDCLFIPADAGQFSVKGTAELLKIRC